MGITGQVLLPVISKTNNQQLSELLELSEPNLKAVFIAQLYSLKPFYLSHISLVFLYYLHKLCNYNHKATAINRLERKKSRFI